MKKAIPIEQNAANIARVLETLAATVPRLKTLCEHYPHEMWYQPTAIGQRTPMETMAHLVHCDERTTESIYAALLLHEPVILDIHPERQWGKLMCYEMDDYHELLTYFAFRRKTLLRMLHPLNDHQWARVIQETGKQRKESVYWRARTMALHEAEHLTEMKL